MVRKQSAARPSNTNSPVVNTADGCEVLFSLGADSREAVDALAERAQSGGGAVFAAPQESNGFMYGCGVTDPDGHRWNVLFMDPARMPGQAS